MKKNAIKSNELFYIQHINDAELTDDELRSFSVKYKEAQNLAKYIQFGQAEADEDSYLSRTYIVRDNISDELVSYFSLKAGMMSHDEKTVNGKTIFNTRPGIELSNFAVNYTYVKNHSKMKGCGLIIFIDFIRPLCLEVSPIIGVKDLYIFALPIDDLMQRYAKDYDFQRLYEISENQLHSRLKPEYDENCVFMFQQLHKELKDI